MSYQLLIAKATVAYGLKRGGGTVASKKEAYLLAAGSIAVFADDEAGTLITPTNVKADIDALNINGFIIAIGGTIPPYVPLITPVIDRSCVSKKTLYAAAVAQVSHVGYNGTAGSVNISSIAAGDKASLLVTDLTAEGYQPGQIKRYEVTAVAGETNATLIGKLNTAINTDPDAVVTSATVLNTGVVAGLALTAKVAGVSFSVSVDDILINATRYATTAASKGNGTFNQVVALNTESDALRGNVATAGQNSLWWKMPSTVDAATTYDVWSFAWKAEVKRGFYTKPVMNQVVQLALPSGSTVPNPNATTVLNLLVSAVSEESGQMDG